MENDEALCIAENLLENCLLELKAMKMFNRSVPDKELLKDIEKFVEGIDRDFI